jgi:hypothetical protein
MNEEYGTPPRAVRLICTADEQGVRVLSRRHLESVVPPSEPIGGEHEEKMQRRSGFWLELRDAEERPCYRRVVADPLPDEIEAPSAGGTFTRRKVLPGSTTFALLVPDLDEADHVSLLRGTAVAGVVSRARFGEIARLPLRAPDRRDGEGEQ